MRDILTVSAIAFAKGYLPCVVLSRATALCFHRRSWSRLKRLPGNGLLRISYGNGPPWFCSCITNRSCTSSVRVNTRGLPSDRQKVKKV